MMTVDFKQTSCQQCVKMNVLLNISFEIELKTFFFFNAKTVE